MDWFRSYHGAPTDPKWIVIAKRANSKPGVVASVWWYLMDMASQARPRGSVAAFDAEVCAAAFGWDEAEIDRVFTAMNDKQLVVDGKLRAWDERNDCSTDRVRRFREMKRGETLGNEMKRDETQKRRDEIRIEKEESPDAVAPKRAKKGCQIPDTWRPNETHRLLASTKAIDIAAEYELFRDHAVANGRICKDWDAAFRNWLRRSVEFKRGNKPPPGSPASQVRNEMPGRGRRETSDLVQGAMSPTGTHSWDNTEKRWVAV